MAIALGAAALCLGGMGSSGCKRAASTSKSLRVQLTAEPVTLDPSLAEDGISIRILGNTMDGLVGYDARGKVVLRLAERMESAQNGRRLIITLRPDARWSDGVPVRAQDFVTGITRSLDPKTASKLAHFLFPIKNAHAIHRGKMPLTQLGVRAKNERVLEIDLESPRPDFKSALGLSVFLPQREDLIVKSQTRGFIGTPTTGPYEIESRSRAGNLLLRAIDPKTPIQNVEFVLVTDETTAVSLFDQRQLDLITRVPAFDLPRLKKDGFVRRDPFWATYYLGIRVDQVPHVEDRRALSNAIDREALVKLIGTEDYPSRRWIPDALFERPPENLSDAGAASTARAGGKTVNCPKPIRLANSKETAVLEFDANSRNSQIAERIQAEWKLRCGFRVTLQSRDWKTYLSGLGTSRAAFYRMGWLAPYPSPWTHLEVFGSESPNNYTGFKDPAFDTGVGTRDLRQLKKWEDWLVFDHAVIIPLFQYAQNHAVQKRVLDFQVNPLGVVRFSELKISPEY